MQGDPFGIQYKVDHNVELVRVNIQKTKSTGRGKRSRMEDGNNFVAANFEIGPANHDIKSITAKKIEQIQFAYKWMPLQDQQYMKSLLSEFKKK